MADYLEAYWKATHPASCTPANPVLDKFTATQSATPEPQSSLHLQVLTKLHPAPTPGIGKGQEGRREGDKIGRVCRGKKHGGKEMETGQTDRDKTMVQACSGEVVENWDKRGEEKRLMVRVKGRVGLSLSKALCSTGSLMFYSS